jgi:hypothetical protein
VDQLLAAVLGAVVGSILGGYMTFKAQATAAVRSSRTDRTIQLYEEWQDAPMLAARITANIVLRENHSSPAPRSFSGLYELLLGEGRDDDWFRVSRVIHFFELMGALKHEGELDSELFWDLLGRYVEYWRTYTLDELIALSERDDEPSESGWSTSIKRLTPAGATPGKE